VLSLQQRYHYLRRGNIFYDVIKLAILSTLYILQFANGGYTIAIIKAMYMKPHKHLRYRFVDFIGSNKVALKKRRILITN